MDRETEIMYMYHVAPLGARTFYSMISRIFSSKEKFLAKSITPPQADGVCKGIILSLPPHPTPLPRERELAETPPQADGVLKTLIKIRKSLCFNKLSIFWLNLGQSNLRQRLDHGLLAGMTFRYISICILSESYATGAGTDVSRWWYWGKIF